MVKHRVQTDGRTFCGRTLVNNGDGRPCKSCERVAETESARSERSCRAESVRRNEIEIPGFGSVPVRTMTAEDVVNPVVPADAAEAAILAKVYADRIAHVKATETVGPEMPLATWEREVSGAEPLADQEDACPVHPGGFNIKGVAVCVGCEREAVELIESVTAAPITSYAADALLALMLGTGPSFMITDRKEVGRAFNIKRGWRVVISTLPVMVDPTVTADIVTPVAEADRDGTAALKPVTFADVAESCGWLSTDIDAVTAVADGPIGEGFWSCCMARPAVAVAFTSEETDQQVWYAACRSCASTVPADRLAVLPEGFIADRMVNLRTQLSAGQAAGECVCDVITDMGAACLPDGGVCCNGCGSVFTRSGEQASVAVLMTSTVVTDRASVVAKTDIVSADDIMIAHQPYNVLMAAVVVASLASWNALHRQRGFAESAFNGAVFNFSGGSSHVESVLERLAIADRAKAVVMIAGLNRADCDRAVRVVRKLRNAARSIVKG